MVVESYCCLICGCVYPPPPEFSQAAESVPFDELSAAWICPDCGVDKLHFEKLSTD